MCGASTEFCVLELSLVSPPWPRSVAHLPPRPPPPPPLSSDGETLSNIHYFQRGQRHRTGSAEDERAGADKGPAPDGVISEQIPA